MITDRDREMYKFAEKYGCITAKQAQLMFYPNSPFGIDRARSRLNNLVKIEWLKSYRESRRRITIYYDKTKHSYHRTLLLDYYAYLVNLGCEISFFKPEFEWVNGKIRSDGFTGYIFDGKPYFNFIEVIASNNELYLEKYDILYKSGEVQKICGEKFPPVILIDNVKRKKPFDLKHTKIIKIDFNFNSVAKVLEQ